jgi:hypothetical protein
LFKDRKPTLPNRYRVVPENGGTPYYVTLERADEPTEEGTALNAATLNNFLTKDYAPKDYNGDGIINDADVTVLRNRIQTGNTTAEDDYNGDGLVDELDVAEYEKMVSRWGHVKKVMGSLYGRFLTPEGLLIQWGSISITPTAADTPTSGFVTFGYAFAETPLVFAQEVTSVPQNVAVGVMRSNVPDPKTQVEIVLTRSGTTPTVINWFAIGKGA